MWEQRAREHREMGKMGMKEVMVLTLHGQTALGFLCKVEAPKENNFGRVRDAGRQHRGRGGGV